MKNAMVSAMILIAATLPATESSAATFLTFDDIPEGTVASNQYTGMTITGGSVLTQNSQLNPPFPPASPPNVLYNYLNGSIIFDFTTLVDAFSGKVTGNTAITLSAYNGATLLGTVATAGANYDGVGTPNALLSLSFPTITRAVFFSSNGFNSFTVDDVTVGGTIINNAVPEPSTWAMMLFGMGAVGVMMRRRRTTTLAKISFA